MRCIERPRIDVVSKNPEFKRPVECLADTSEQRAADTYPTKTRVKIEVLEFGASCIDDGKADHISTQLSSTNFSDIGRRRLHQAAEEIKLLHRSVEDRKPRHRSGSTRALDDRDPCRVVGVPQPDVDLAHERDATAPRRTPTANRLNERQRS